MAASRWGVDSLGAVAGMPPRYQRRGGEPARAAPAGIVFGAMASGSPQEVSAEFAEALEVGDLPAALELWHEDALMLRPDGQSIRGREAIAAALSALIANDVAVDIALAGVFAAGEVAVGVGTLTVSGEPPDGPAFSQRSQSVVVYAKDADGRWRIALDAPWGLPPA